MFSPRSIKYDSVKNNVLGVGLTVDHTRTEKVGALGEGFSRECQPKPKERFYPS